MIIIVVVAIVIIIVIIIYCYCYCCCYSQSLNHSKLFTITYKLVITIIISALLLCVHDN